MLESSLLGGRPCCVRGRPDRREPQRTARGVLRCIVSGLAVGLLCGAVLESRAAAQESPFQEQREARLRDLRSLAKSNTGASFEALLEALGDPDGRIADEAQWLLGGEVLWSSDLLFGRSGLLAKDVGVRRRVAELWGRPMGQEFPSDSFRQAFKDRDPIVRRYLFWSLSRNPQLTTGDLRTVRSASYKALERASDPLERASAVSLIRRVSWSDEGVAAGVEWLEQALGDRDFRVRAAAVGELENWETDLDDPVGLAAEYLTDEHPAVRRAAQGELMEIGTPEAMQRLVTALGECEDRVERWWLLDALKRASGVDLGNEHEDWEAWLGRLPASWKAKTQRVPSRRVPQLTEPANLRPRDPALEDALTDLARVPIQSRSLAILIDRALLDRELPEAAGTVGTWLREELAATLAELPEGIELQVIAFGEDVKPWKRRPVSLGEGTPGKLMRWFDKLAGAERSDLWGAIELALEAEELDTLIAITDGSPTAGLHQKQELVALLLEERNRFRNVAMQFLLIDPDSTARRVWARFAWRQRGFCVDYNSAQLVDAGR